MHRYPSGWRLVWAHRRQGLDIGGSTERTRSVLVLDPLTKTQSRQLCEIGRRIIRAIDPDDHRPDDQPLLAAMPAQAP